MRHGRTVYAASVSRIGVYRIDRSGSLGTSTPGTSTLGARSEPEALNGAVEIFNLKWFGYAFVHASREAFVATAGHGHARDADNGYTTARFSLPLPYDSGGFDAIQFRHLLIHQNQVKFLFFQGTQSLAAIPDCDNRVASLFEQVNHDFLIYLGIFR
jgi:hypothetical protein